jgi:hypothetical protein
LNNWASLADGSCFDAFTRAIGMLPAHSSLVALLTTLKQCVTIDGAQLVVQLVSRAFKPSALDEAFRSLTTAPDPRASAEDLFRLVCHAPSTVAAVLKQQAPLWFDAGIFVPAFITAAFLKLAAANAGLLELVMSQCCVQGYMRHALAALEAIIEAGSDDFTQTMRGAVATMKLPVLLRVVDHAVHCCRYRRAHRAVLAAVLCLPPSHAAISYLSTDLWRQRSLTHTAACALVDLLLSTCGDFRAEPLKTVLHCLGDLFARESFATSAHESHHFAVCAALRRMLMAPNSTILASDLMPLLFNGISNHMKGLVDATRAHGMWVAETVAPLLSAQGSGSEKLELLTADERAQLQKDLETEGSQEVVSVYFHMARDDATAPDSLHTRSSQTPFASRDAASSGSNVRAAEGSPRGAIGISIADDGWGSDGNEGPAGASESEEDDVAAYDLPTEVRDKMWRSLEEGVQLLLHEDANKVEQALRVAAQSIRCSRQIVSEFSDRLWKALQHARAKFDEDALSVCALSAMSQVTFASRSLL